MSGHDSTRTGLDRSPLDVAETAFRLLTTGPHPLALDCAGLGAGLPDRAVPLGELRGLLLGRGVGAAGRDAVWRELVTRARGDDPAWMVGMVGMALPGLRAAAGRLAAGFRGETADIDAEVLAGFVGAVRSVDLRWKRVAMHLCRAGYDAGLRYRRTEEGHAERAGACAGWWSPRRRRGRSVTRIWSSSTRSPSRSSPSGMRS